MDLGIVFQSVENKNFRVEGYVDASYADDVYTRRTTIGNIFMLCGGPISWESKLHPAMATSTNNAE
jgi:hypothetical protein